MKVEFQTKITPLITLYDSNDKDPPSELSIIIKSFLQPVVQVHQGDFLLYSNGEFYDEPPFKLIITIGIIFLLALAYRLFFKK